MNIYLLVSELFGLNMKNLIVNLQVSEMLLKKFNLSHSFIMIEIQSL